MDDLWFKILIDFPSKITLILYSFEGVIFFEYSKVVVVWQLLKVKLMDVFLGICGSLLPQYFTKAILLGLCQE